MAWQGGTQQIPGLKYLPILKQRNRPLIEPADLPIRILHLPKSLIQGLSPESRFAGLIDHRISMAPHRQGIVAQCPIGIALQFGDISQIIQSEWVIRIQQVGPIEESLGFVLMPALEFDNAIA